MPRVVAVVRTARHRVVLLSLVHIVLLVLVAVHTGAVTIGVNVDLALVAAAAVLGRLVLVLVLVVTPHHRLESAQVQRLWMRQRLEGGRGVMLLVLLMMIRSGVVELERFQLHHLVHVDVRVDDLEVLGRRHVVLHLLDVALLLGAAILEPGDHLGGAERQLGGDAVAVVRREVALRAEPPLQLEYLVGREGGAVLALALERRRRGRGGRGQGGRGERGRRARVVAVRGMRGGGGDVGGLAADGHCR